MDISTLMESLLDDILRKISWGSCWKLLLFHDYIKVQRMKFLYHLMPFAIFWIPLHHLGILCDQNQIHIESWMLLWINGNSEMTTTSFFSDFSVVLLMKYFFLVSSRLSVSCEEWILCSFFQIYHISRILGTELRAYLVSPNVPVSTTFFTVISHECKAWPMRLWYSFN